MAFSTAGFTTGLFGLLKTGLFWIILIIGFGIVVFGMLIIRKNRRITVKGIEVLDIGREKVSIRTGRKLNGGWFKHHSTFFGLWDYGGEEVFKLRDGRQVIGVSSKDFHEFNGSTCLIFARSPEDPRILVPLSRIKAIGGDLFTKIAPVDLRSTAVDIIKKAEKETQDKVQQVLQWVFWGGIIIFSFITIILVVQMVKNGQTEAKDLILEAGKLDEAKLKMYCQGLKSAGETIASTGGAP